MISSVLAMAGIVLSFVALGMRPSFYGEPLGKLRHIRSMPKPKVAMLTAAMACLMLG